MRTFGFALNGFTFLSSDTAAAGPPKVGAKHSRRAEAEPDKFVLSSTRRSSVSAHTLLGKKVCRWFVSWLLEFHNKVLHCANTLTFVRDAH